jgi:hypothetical protein
VDEYGYRYNGFHATGGRWELREGMFILGMIRARTNSNPCGGRFFVCSAHAIVGAGKPGPKLKRRVVPVLCYPPTSRSHLLMLRSGLLSSKIPTPTAVTNKSLGILGCPCQRTWDDVSAFRLHFVPRAS